MVGLALPKTFNTLLVNAKNCQLNRPSLGKTVSTWPEADVWERLHMDWVYVKDQGNILVIVDAGSGWIEAFPRETEHQKHLKYILVKSLQDSEYRKL